jgi:hypothetical protein
MVRWPPLLFGISKVVYFCAADILYRMYETALGRKPSREATSFSDVAAFSVASLDMGDVAEELTHRYSYATVMVRR